MKNEKENKWVLRVESIIPKPRESERSKSSARTTEEQEDVRYYRHSVVYPNHCFDVYTTIHSKSDSVGRKNE